MFTHPAVTRAAPLVVSFALHAVVVGGALAFGQFLSPRPMVLEAVLVAPDPPPAAEPPRPDPPRPEPPKPKPPKAVVPPKPIPPPPPPREIVNEPPPAPVAPTPIPTRPPETAPPPALAAAPAPSPAPIEPRASDAPGPRRASAPVSPGVEAVPAPAPAAPVAAPPVTARTVPDASQLARPSGGRQVIPSYPSSARRLGIQGTTMLRVYVAADGQVTDVQVDETAGHPDLDRAAADAVRRWRFEPGRRGSEAVAMWVRVPVQFVLK